MRSVATSLLLASVLAVLSAVGCSRNEESKSYAPPGNASTPESAKEMMMTDAERQQQVEQKQEQAEQKDFDAAEGANK